MNSDAVLSLVMWAAQLTGYPVPAELPEVRIVTREWMGRRACPTTPERCPVLGLYDDQNVVYVIEGLTWQAQDHITLHELVHWLQHHSGEFDLEACVDIAAREREAYHVQSVYIWQIQSGIVGMLPPTIGCGHD